MSQTLLDEIKAIRERDRGTQVGIRSEVLEQYIPINTPKDEAIHSLESQGFTVTENKKLEELKRLPNTGKVYKETEELFIGVYRGKAAPFVPYDEISISIHIRGNVVKKVTGLITYRAL